MALTSANEAYPNWKEENVDTVHQLQEALAYVLNNLFDESPENLVEALAECFPDQEVSAKNFEEAGLMTRNQGVVVNGIQITIVA